MKTKGLIALGILMLCVAIAGRAETASGKIEDKVAEVASSLTSLSYDLHGTQVDNLGKESSWITKYRATREKWRLEKYWVINGKENLEFIEAFDGKKYQMLHVDKKRQLSVASKIMPETPLYPWSYYDNFPLSIFGFLEFQNSIVLPDNIKAPDLSQILSVTEWKKFIDSATKKEPEAQSDGEVLSVKPTGRTDGLWGSRYDVHFGREGGISPSLLERVGADGKLLMSIEVLEFEKTPVKNFCVPKHIKFTAFGSIGEGRGRKYRDADIVVSNIAVNLEMLPASFDIDVKLANEIWDVDRLIVTPVRKTNFWSLGRFSTFSDGDWLITKSIVTSIFSWVVMVICFRVAKIKTIALRINWTGSLIGAILWTLFLMRNQLASPYTYPAYLVLGLYGILVLLIELRRRKKS